jgi:hypothetical protein
MKKFFLTLAIGTALLASLQAFGQGYVFFSGLPRGVWDGWTTGVPHTAATNQLAFLFGSGTPLVDSIMPFTPTNGLAFPGPGAWSAILNDPNFTLATNSDTGQLISARCAANGAWVVSSTVPVAGTVANQTYQMYVIGWDCNYPDPLSAAVAGSVVGWSDVFSYTTVTVIGTPATMSASGLLPFGVPAVPEPATFTLAGLGVVAWMSLRRSKR